MKPKSCEFNLATASVELRFADGPKIAIYCPAMEDMIAHTISKDRTELADL